MGLLQSVLTRAGFEVSSATSGAEAVTGFNRVRPDLVLLDVHLPDQNGLEICRILRDGPGAAQTPILFISSNDEVSWKVKGFQAGGVDYIPKPIAAEEVVARVTTHLRLKQAYEKLAELQAERIQRLAGAQQTIMPSPLDLPEAGFQVCLHQVGQAGGDFYDVLPVGNRLVDYIVADASGHDLAASFWTAALKTLLGEYATAANPPDTILRSINSALHRILPSGVFFTLAYLRLNRQTGRAVIANAGHPPGILVPGGQGPPSILRSEGDVVGPFPDATFASQELKLKPKDRVLLFSDGLIESTGLGEQGLSRVIDACERHRQAPLNQLVTQLVQEVTQGTPVQDDVLLMGIEL
jgi:sigma-B regulation protein RsbU (phosphoserine phosphatase)